MSPDTETVAFPNVVPAAREKSLHRRATLMLFLATVFWSISFPLAKAVEAGQRLVLPEASTWFLAAICVVFRFGIAALVLTVLNARTLRDLTRGELGQGIGLGAFAGTAILLQNDGLLHTSASTSAFLTSCYCVLIPLFIALRVRRLPGIPILVSCALVMAGMIVLSGFNWHTFRLGRGEFETMVCSIFFTGQILLLGRESARNYHAGRVTIVMFATIACISVVAILPSVEHVNDLALALQGPVVMGSLLILTFACTLLTFGLMNKWQKHLSATEAGLIYCVEPVWTSLFALFLPGWLGALGGFSYPNERVTSAMLIGGGLITAANVLLQTLPQSRPAKAVAEV